MTAAVGHAPSPVPGSRRLGSAPSDQAISLDIVLAPRDPDALAAFVRDVSTPGSPSFGDFIAPGEFAGRFGPAPSTIDAVSAALRAAGLSPGRPSRSGLVIPVTTTVAEAEAAFQISIESYRLPSGEEAVANVGRPQLAASVAPAVDAIVGLDTRARVQPEGLRRSVRPPGGPRAAATPSAAPALTPALLVGSSGPRPCAQFASLAQSNGLYTMDQIASAYDMSGFYAAGNGGAGASIALAEFEPYRASDIQAFQSCYGTSATVTNQNVGRGPGTGAGSGEAALDIQVAIGIAPEARILVYQGPNDGSTDVYARIADDDLAQVVSTSWGVCETSANANMVAAEATIFQQMAAQGQTVVAASGDQGSSDCYSSRATSATQLAVDDPASQPAVTGVGGTTMTQPSDPPVEQVWNRSATREGSGGGGISTRWTMPAWQTGPGVIGTGSSARPCQARSGYCRQVPDVAALADPRTGYVIRYNGNTIGIGGTSAAAPLWGALTALVLRSPGCVTSGRLGLLSPALYRLAAGTLIGLNDITIGDNDYLGTHGGLYPAGAGYDMASGLGTPIGGALQAGLCGTATAPTFTSTADATFTVASAAAVTVTASGTPAPRLRLLSGTLAAGLAFSDEGGGRATISGTPAAGSAGRYTVVIEAANGVAPAASQTSVLTVTDAVTSAPPVDPPPPAAAPAIPTPTSALPPPATAPPTITPARGGAAVRLAAIATRTLRVEPGGRMTVRLACPRGTGGCTMAATLTPAGGGKGTLTTISTLARSRTVAVASGRSRAVTLRLGQRDRRRLARARHGRLRAQLTIRARFGDRVGRVSAPLLLQSRRP
ncbi:protease pro-enzyme activation domain-containing protein [Conexibacter sp. CPCC 206217]|uniref:protease pro-enzyme activation domain-containing protein n=1 Tax=Conexibacter sp. CPCC 206217 TaxID=3064574 RepID=UPI0027291794|nr:protease pro-enzyme activation domain-containing protein [Conexibacter sp. CPCC 206217]MDO8208861.1 protease pro-enzyme activation domain-containing protein [Conexibacter sp. CPCC 206217]